MLWGENRGKWKGRQSLGVEPRTLLAWATSALPLSCPGFNSCRLPAFSLSLFSPHNLYFQREARCFQYLCFLFLSHLALFSALPCSPPTATHSPKSSAILFFHAYLSLAQRPLQVGRGWRQTQGWGGFVESLDLCAWATDQSQIKGIQ